MPSRLESYGYGDLVDRWFAVYDKYYRSQEPSDRAEYKVQRYESAWSRSALGSPATAPLGLDELKRLAIEGSASKGSTALTIKPVREGALREGEYHSMPLEGRFHLLPPKVLSLYSEEQGGKRDLTGDGESTPKLTPFHEAHFLHSQSVAVESKSPYQPELPSPSLARSTPQTGYFSIPLSLQPQLQIPLQLPPLPRRPSSRSIDSPRPPSPPLLVWNPSTEPPPTNAPPQNTFKPDERFENVWDQAWHSPGMADDPNALFRVPPPSKIPQQLIKEGLYNNVISPPFSPESMISQYLPETDSSVIFSPPTPFLPPISFKQPIHDIGKAPPVFPWEDKSRQVAARVFPRSAASPQLAAQVIHKDETAPFQSTELFESSPVQLSASRLLVPQVGGRNCTSEKVYNAWDTVPSIQRYASRLQGNRTPKIYSISDRNNPRRRRRRSSSGTYKSWEDPADDSSNEGDDEDEESDGEQGSDQRSRVVNRRVSRRNRFKDERTGKLYQSQGTQTKRVAHKERAIQSTSSYPILLTSNLTTQQEHWQSANSIDEFLFGQGPKTMSARSSSFGAPINKSNGISSSIAKADALDVIESNVSTLQGVQTNKKDTDRLQTSESMSPTMLRSPAFTPPSETTLEISATGGHIAEAQMPISTNALFLLKSKGRRWDPARGVDVFKHQSEQVLERFLSMGSWDGT